MQLSKEGSDVQTSRQIHTEGFVGWECCGGGERASAQRNDGMEVNSGRNLSFTCLCRRHSDLLGAVNLLIDDAALTFLG